MKFLCLTDLITFLTIFLFGFQAYVRRFPTCDMIPIMADTEIVSEKNSEDGAVEEVSRRCKLNVEAPYLLKKVSTTLPA